MGENAPVSFPIFAVFLNRSGLGVYFLFFYFSLFRKNRTRLVRTNLNPGFNIYICSGKFLLINGILRTKILATLLQLKTKIITASFARLLLLIYK